MFYIFDANGQIVGNPKGYATHKAAHKQANSTKTKAGRALWAAYYAKDYAPGARRLMWAISTMETAKARGYAK